VKLKFNKTPLPLKTNTNWRVVWYCVLLWLVTFLVAGIVIIPWFYLVVAIIVFLTTVYYFKIFNPFIRKRGRRNKNDRDNILIFALISALIWFVILALLNLAEIAHFYYFDFMFYFSDFRNWYLLALVLLVPVVYGLILENAKYMKQKRKKTNALKPLSSAKIVW